MREIFFIWLKSQTGATAIEYALIAAGISLSVASVIFFLGEDIGAVFDNLAGLLP